MSTAAPWRYPHAVSSVLVTPPTEEPLTLLEAKLRAGLDWPPGDPRDQLMTDMIAAARQKVELDTGLALLKQTRAITLSYAPGAPIPLPMHALPLISITDPAGRVVAPGTVLVDLARRTVFMGAGYTEGGTWTIEAGWLDKATLQKEAPLLVQAVGLLTAHYATAGRDMVVIGTIAQEVPFGYEECIQPYRLIWVT